MVNYKSLDKFIKNTLAHRTTFREMADDHDRLTALYLFSPDTPTKTATMRGYLPIDVYVFDYLKKRKDGTEVRGVVIVKPRSRGLVTLEYHTYDTRGGKTR